MLLPWPGAANRWNYRYAVAQMKQPGVSIIQTRDVRPANTLERIAYER